MSNPSLVRGVNSVLVERVGRREDENAEGYHDDSLTWLIERLFLPPHTHTLNVATHGQCFSSTNMSPSRISRKQFPVNQSSNSPVIQIIRRWQRAEFGRETEELKIMLPPKIIWRRLDN